MYPVPLTYCFDYKKITREARPWLFTEFADAGAKHLVLSSGIISDIAGDYNQLDIIEKEMADAGLDFVDAHAQYGIGIDMNLLTPTQRRLMIARHRFGLETAAYFNVKTITIHIGNNRTPELAALPLQKHIDAVTEALDLLLPLAEELGITICIENIWTQTTTPERLLDFKSKFPTDALGFCYDSGHANIMDNGRNFAESAAHTSWQYTSVPTPPWEDKALEKILGNVVTCHLHDNYGEKDNHDLPGNGNVDWQKTRSLLMKAPRLAAIQSEVVLIKNNISIKRLCQTFQTLFPECADI